MKLKHISQMLLLTFVLPAQGGLGLGKANSPGEPAALLDAQNVDYIGHLNRPVNAAALQGNHAFIGEGGSLALLDISIPEAPKAISKTELRPDIMQDVEVDGDYAYLADGDSGLRVVNISSPVDPFEVGFYDTLGQAWDIAIR